MSSKEVIEKIAKNKLVETILQNYLKRQLNEDEKELVQDIYISLLTKDPNKIVRLYNTIDNTGSRREINCFITAIIRNNIMSKTSPYYTKYKRWSTKRSDFNYAPNDLTNVMKKTDIDEN